MKRIVITLLLLAGIVTLSLGQSPNDSITMKRVFGGHQFIYRGSQLEVKQLLDVMKLNEVAHKQIKSAKTNDAVSNVISSAGAFMVGWTLGDLAWGRDPNNAVLGVGVGLIAVSIPFSIISTKKAKQAVATWNNGLRTSSQPVKSELKLSMTGNGFGLTFRF